jgi:hypothetical protein
VTQPHPRVISTSETPRSDRYLSPARYDKAAQKLHRFLLDNHWNGRELLFGPDPGIRFNARIGRFVKSYTRFLRWSDDLFYMQAQGYWVLNNWLLYRRHGDEQYRSLAERTSESVLTLQRKEGYWPYPNPEWRGRVATVEGCFAALGLMETFAHTGEQRFLDGAIRWQRYLREVIGYRLQSMPGMLAVNYFAHNSGTGGGVPNNSTLALWTAARLTQLTGDASLSAENDAMLAWLAHVQRADGELPYQVVGEGERPRVHFLCYQYNAFEFMDLAHYHRITGDGRALPLMESLAGYLTRGLEGGTARYECAAAGPEVAYYTTAVAQALSQAERLGLVEAPPDVDRAYRRTLAMQRRDGGFPYYSTGNYGVLSDRRSYPRYLVMMLHHLILRAEQLNSVAPGGSR